MVSGPGPFCRIQEKDAKTLARGFCDYTELPNLSTKRLCVQKHA